MVPLDANGAAAGHGAAASVQQQTRSELLQRLQFFALEPKCVLDLGAGTCQGTLELARRFRHARIIALDLAPQLLAQATRSLWHRRRYDRVGADAYALPFADAGCDLVFSNLMLPWCEGLDPLFAELRRVLRPGGLLLFSSFAPGTLQELRDAWASVDAGRHVNEFPDLPQIAAALTRSGFVEPVIDVERHCQHFASLRALQRELRQLGARRADRARSRGLGGRAEMERVRAAYERVRTPAGLPVTWELLYGAAFATAAGDRSVAGTARSGEQVVPLDRIGHPGRVRGAPRSGQ